MAITAVSNTPYPTGFSVNATSSDLSGCESLLAAVTGKSIYLEYLIINSAAELTVTIGEGETTNAVTTVIAGPFYMPANGTIVVPYIRPLKLTAATALTVDASGAGVVTIIAQGYVE